MNSKIRWDLGLFRALIFLEGFFFAGVEIRPNRRCEPLKNRRSEKSARRASGKIGDLKNRQCEPLEKSARVLPLLLGHYCSHHYCSRHYCSRRWDFVDLAQKSPQWPHVPIGATLVAIGARLHGDVRTVKGPQGSVRANVKGPRARSDRHRRHRERESRG